MTNLFNGKIKNDIHSIAFLYNRANLLLFESKVIAQN